MKRRRNRMLIVGLLLGCASLLSAQNLEQLFKNIPEEIDPLLTSKTRTELIEYFKNGQIDTLQNKFGGSAFLLKYDTIHQSVVVRNSATSLFEMRVIERKHAQPMVAVINTVEGSIKSSQIAFYDTSWQRLSLSLQMPRSVDWLDEGLLAKASGVDVVWVRKSIQLNFVSLRFDDVEPILIAENHSAEFLSEADASIVTPFLSKSPVLLELKEDGWVRK